jgi:predicted kinase
MEAVIFIGIQGAGKSTFYRRRFFDTHVRINGDMLKTMRREAVLIKACFDARQKFVVDKMNLTREQRARYITEAKSYGFRVAGYYFQTALKKAIERNGRREGKARVPDTAVYAAFHNLQIPHFDEGFDELYYVWIDENGEFVSEKRLAGVD